MSGPGVPMRIVRHALVDFDRSLPLVEIRVDRHKLSKRLWRASADDGTDFGFELEKPLEHGDVVHVSESHRYAIGQTAEPVLEIMLDPKPDASAVLGWVVGNMHFVIEALPDRIRTPDDSALRQTFERVGIQFLATSAVFRPHRLASVVGHSHAPVQENPFLRPVRHAGATH
ncbi:hypothetical protein ASA1KI_00700 [Opitutales bacterium ASA1]|uniref:urease accessory protein UreE n=1 Tax=Congregicoccus parvus TaxID=3081749 RepID=UPI002B2C249F|nr:hypothetical protein ASA1KI_00700 [Opitutales bacterium ASA1]